MTLHVHRSHAMERLAARFVELAFGTPGDPFDSPLVAVQGRGMERWLAQTCANTTGVFAGVRITRVRGFVDAICESLLADESEVRLDPATLPFRVLAHLDSLRVPGDDSEFTRYLDAADAERRGQLALRLAESLDRAIVHRPKTIVEWLAGRVEDDPIVRAEAALVRAIVADAPGHEAKRIRGAIARLDASTPLLLSAIPRRVYLFGVGTLAPLYLELVHAVSKVAEIHLFVLSPGEIWLSDLARHEAARGEVGSLIHGFGKLAADFQFLLEGIDGVDSEYVGEIDEPTNALATLRHDLCTLTARGDGDGQEPRIVVAPDDRSFVVHACHSPMRELEVLHALLVDLLERDPSLAPSDIAVLTTDVERYAPLVHAVFGRDPEASARIPYHVADRGARESLGFVDAFFALLDAASERLTLPIVADLLDRAAIRDRFGIDEAAVPRLVEALREAGARYGIDGSDRAREGQPPFEEHTFERALNRIALGLAVADVAPSFHGIAPLAVASGKEGAAFGGLFGFFDAFESLRATVVDEAPLAEVLTSFERVVDGMLSSEAPFEDEASLVRDGLARLRDRARVAGFEGPIARTILLEQLAGELEEGAAGGFLGGGIPFCRQVPMRAIPFRVICLLGLDDGAFPRNVEVPRFDLVSRSPLRGDRSPRDDDRQAFLETLLSARDALHLFYVGHDIATGTERAVSSVVARTLDVLERALVREDSGPVRELLHVDHRLHAFDPAYFEVDARSRGLVSRDHDDYAGARASLGEKSVTTPDLAIDAEDPVEIVRLDDLLSFLERPDAYYLTRVLEVSTDEEPDLLPERELLITEGLDAYTLTARALALADQGLTTEAIGVRLREESRLPPGSAGEVEAIAASELVGQLREAHAPGRELPPVPFEIEVEGRRLVGTFHGIHESGLYRRVASRMSDARRFRTHVESWVASLVPGSAVPQGATLVARAASRAEGDVAVFHASPTGPDEARRALSALVAAFVEARSRPVPVDASTLGAYARRRVKGMGRDEALEAAFEAFRSAMDDEHSSLRGARVQLYGRAILPGATPLDPSVLGGTFVRVAEEAYLPFVRAKDEDESGSRRSR